MYEFLDEIIKSKQFRTPIEIERDNEYYDSLRYKFHLLVKELIRLNADKSFIIEAGRYLDIIITALDQYYKGDMITAQTKINSLIDEFDENMGLAISNINNSISFIDLLPVILKRDELNDNNVQFYRARCNDQMINYKAEEMLHIPFNSREFIKTERFSVPGLPCLYLGTTSYDCWIEMGCPPDHSFNVSPILLDNSQKILNLTVNDAFVNEFLQRFRDENLIEEVDKERVLEIFKLWMLSIATSYRVKQKNRMFKSEYLISQLIMIACKKRGLNGVAYFSKQLKYDCFARIICVNLALFANYQGEKLLSSICSHLKTKDSFNFSLTSKLNYSLKYQKINLSIDQSGLIRNIGDFKRQYPYKETTFYDFDQFLWTNEDLENIDIVKINA